MFQEEEPGKPRNWCFTISLISSICLVNLAIFVVLRVLLDTENEFDEPIVQGKLREDLTQFLGIFSLSFCFGCWCCFCCTGKCFKCCSYLNPKRWKIGQLWAHLIGHQLERMQTLRRKQAKEEQLDLHNLSSAAAMENGTGKERPRKKGSHPGTSPAAKAIPAEQLDDVSIGPKASRLHSSGSSSSAAAAVQTVERSSRKQSREELEKFRVERVRRWSMAPACPNVLVRQWQGEERPKSRGRTAEEDCGTAIRGVDFVQIPVQNMTPSMIAIVDERKIEQAYEEVDLETPSVGESERKTTE